MLSLPSLQFIPLSNHTKGSIHKAISIKGAEAMKLTMLSLLFKKIYFVKDIKEINLDFNLEDLKIIVRSPPPKGV